MMNGHKRFLSAPMCDAFLMLAQAPGGLGCFCLPRFAPDGTPDALRIQRLKHKVGNRSNASSRVEFMDAWAEPVGDEGRAVPTIHAGWQRLRTMLSPGPGAGLTDAHARITAASIATTMQASRLLRHAPSVVADAFCTSRLRSAADGEHAWRPGGGGAFGLLAADDAALGAIVARALPG